MNLQIKLVSSLVKILPGEDLKEKERTAGSALKGEEFAFQAVCFCENAHLRESVNVKVESELKEYIELYEIENVPCELPAYPDAKDDMYLSDKPGLYPDLMKPCTDTFSIKAGMWNTLWVNVRLREDSKAGKYPIKIIFTDKDGNETFAEFELTVIDAVLPKQKTHYTQWFYCDCIAQYYNEEVFSESNWIHIEQFIKTAAEHGMDIILTPIFTPPLDTQIGSERPTVQLVKVYCENGKYNFEFDMLDKWIDICHRCGIERFEISHFFTQWGAKCAPKVIVHEDGREYVKFGWHTDALSDEYREFLRSLIIALKEYFKNKGIPNENLIFHVSDEPGKDVLEHYKAVRSIFADLLEDYVICDAMSKYDFYQQGAVKNPVVAIDHIEPFLDNNVPDLWAYRCCSQNVDVSNGFIAMPAWRNRIIGCQLYKYKISGFLQWGYNFYNSQFSVYPINPYLTTDAAGAFPGGDPFVVYPGNDGPEMSTRLKVFFHALQDIRAFELLETRLTHEEIVKRMEESGEITFKKYPVGEDYILNLREWVNSEIAKNT